MRKSTMGRAGTNRLALGGATLLILAIAAAAAVADGRPERAMEVGGGSVSAVDDTMRVAELLAELRGTRPVPCMLATSSLQGRFGRGWSNEEPGIVDHPALQWSGSGELGVSALPQLVEGLRSEDACARRAAAVLFGRVRSGDVAGALAPLLRSPTVGHREAAALALGHRGREADAPALRPLLEDADPTVRRAAAWAVGQTEDRGSVDALSRLLRDDVAAVRAQAAHALGAIEDGRAIAPLSDLLTRDPDPAVRRAAARALGRFDSGSYEDHDEPDLDIDIDIDMPDFD